MADEEPGDRDGDGETDGWGTDGDDWGAEDDGTGQWGGDDGEDDEREWRFSVDEVGPDAEDDETDETDGDGENGNVAGSITPEADVEPGSPDLENVAFVALGALLTVLVFAGLAISLTPRTIAIITAAVAAIAGALYLLFRRF